MMNTNTINTTTHYFYTDDEIDFYGDDIVAIDPLGVAIISGDRYTGHWLEVDGLKPGDTGFEERKALLSKFSSINY